jgi:hypothetical protein
MQLSQKAISAEGGLDIEVSFPTPAKSPLAA